MIQSVRTYIQKAISNEAMTGTKALLLDQETKGIMSLVYEMHEVEQEEVYYVGPIDPGRKKEPVMATMSAVILVRANTENFRFLQQELADPMFKEYHIYFTNMLPQGYLGRLAEADRREVVKGVHEFYADYYAINPDFCSLNLAGSLDMSATSGPFTEHMTAAEAKFARSVDGVCGMLLSLKVKPVIRVHRGGGSDNLAARFGRAVHGMVENNREVFQFRRPANAPCLLIMDRKDDPISPLLSQWTYQAMVHELIGVRNNLVALPGRQDAVLSAMLDPFFREQMYSDFGAFAEAVQSILADYQSSKQMHGNIESIEDMQRFMENYPELKQKGNRVDAHVALMAELNRIVDERDLMEVSELEQSIACDDSKADHLRRIKELLDSGRVNNLDALRLVCLFALRYESSPRQVLELKRALEHHGVGAADVALIDALLEYGGASRRCGDLFENGSLVRRMFKNVTRSVAGVENVFTRHKPLLATILEQLSNGTLPQDQFPTVTPDAGAGPPGKVLVYILGGATFEEAAHVARLNRAAEAAGKPTRIVLAGTSVQNSLTFLDDLRRLAAPPAGGVGLTVDGGAQLGVRSPVAVAAAGGGGMGSPLSRRGGYGSIGGGGSGMGDFA